MAGTEWRATRLALIALQWLLVFWGLALIALALNTYAYETAYFATLPAAAPGADNYRPPVRQRMMTGVGRPQFSAVLETAQAVKFEETLREALGEAPPRPAGFDHLEALPQRCEVMAADLAAVKDFIRQHARD